MILSDPQLAHEPRNIPLSARGGTISDLYSCLSSSHASRSGTLGGFLRTERRTLLLCTGVYLALYLTAIFVIDVHYFFSRMQDDQLKYFLKGWFLTFRGGAPARFAENLPPFQYVSLPGYMQSPLLLLSSDFAIQLRLIQLVNLVELLAVGVLASYLLSEWAPGTWKPFAAPIVFASLLLSNIWETNVFLPMCDILFALFLCLSMLLIRSIRSFANGAELGWKLVLIALFVALAAMTKLLGFLLPIYALLCWIPAITPESRKRVAKLALAFGLLVLTLSAFCWRNILWYGNSWLVNMSLARPIDWLLNLAALSFPAQIIPNFHYLCTGALTGNAIEFTNFHWLASPRDIAMESLGCTITGLIVLGMWRSRKTILPEIVLLCFILPIIAPVTTSTVRYLQPFQPLIIACFLANIPNLFSGRIARLLNRYPAVVPFLAASAVFVCLLKIAGMAERNHTAVHSLSSGIANVSATYRKLDESLAGVDRNQSYLLLFPEDTSGGKWQAIRGLRYMAPSANLERLVREDAVYAVFDHDRKWGSEADAVEAHALASLAQWGRFRAELVLDANNHDAWGRIYRILPLDAPAFSKHP